jgi:hypothetical protein
MEWRDELFGLNVKKKEIKRSGDNPFFPNSEKPVGVLHTTEATTVEGAWNKLNTNHSAPHFITGENRIVL